MKRVLVSIAAGVLLLAGCSGGQQAAAPATTASPVPLTTTLPAPATNVDEGPGMTQFSPRGAEIETIGGRQTAIKDNVGGYALDFTVDAITPDARCVPAYPEAPNEPLVNGHFIAVSFSVETRPQYSRAALSIDPFAEQNFHYVGADGQTTQKLYGYESGSCQVTPLPSTMLPSSKYKGVVMLDVPATSGILVLDASGGAVNGVSNLFEWAFPGPGGAATSQPTIAVPAPSTTAVYVPPATTQYAPPAPETSTRRVPAPTQAPATSSTKGCAAAAMAAGRFNPSCPEYQGYLDPGGPGRGPTSGDIQNQYAKQQCAAGVKSYC